MIDKVVINTDARDILEKNGLVDSDRVMIRDRKKELCGDHISMNLIIEDDLAATNADHYIMTHTTNPLLTSTTLNNAFHQYEKAQSLNTADSLFGDDYHWSILRAGKNQISLASIGAAQGSNVRVGLEDSPWIGPGQLAKSNADQVNKIRHVLKGLSLDIASPDEAREMLGLKGSDQVDF